MWNRQLNQEQSRKASKGGLMFHEKGKMWECFCSSNDGFITGTQSTFWNRFANVHENIMPLVSQTLNYQLHILRHDSLRMPIGVNVQIKMQSLQLYRHCKCDRPFCPLIYMYPWISCFLRAVRNELDDNIQIYVHIIFEHSVQVISRSNTSEASPWLCHDVNWSQMERLRCLLVHVILSSGSQHSAI